MAHYCTKAASQKMLFKGKLPVVSKFRLNAINYSNDPTEGKTLLDYLFDKKYLAKEEVNVRYRAFAGCFTFNYNSLNQFRLYGKENDKEGTGLSLVFGDSFFSKVPRLPLTKTIMLSDQLKAAMAEEQEKHTLFRCIYIDPESDRVETVGQKDTYLFYRENQKNGQKYTEAEVRKYHEQIECVVSDVRKMMAELKKLAQALIPEIVEQLLVNLRYLTKHIAFKEEQECRIIKIHSLVDTKIQVSEDFKQMYVEYQEIPRHIKRIYFAPKATEMELFQDVLKHEGLGISCEKSNHPWA